jgi:hypothetical protein
MALTSVLRGEEILMPQSNIDAIVCELNSLLDQQLAFLDSDLHRVNVSEWQEYERRYGRIRSLCEELDPTAAEQESQYMAE